MTINSGEVKEQSKPFWSATEQYKREDFDTSALLSSGKTKEATLNIINNSGSFLKERHSFVCETSIDYTEYCCLKDVGDVSV